MSFDEIDPLEQAILDSDLLDRILDRHRRTVHTLLAEAAVEWLADGCPRYNDREASCAASFAGRVLRKIDEAKASAIQPMLTLETGAWTAEHFSGEADPTTVPPAGRSDLARTTGGSQDERRVQTLTVRVCLAARLPTRWRVQVPQWSLPGSTRVPAR
jgi:hypothetical protein